jgi:hypothetical protein
VGHIALKVPLGARALARRREGHHPANPRIHTLRNSLDDAPLAGGVASFKDYDHLELVGDNLVLQLDQLGLQAEQFPEIQAAIDRASLGAISDLIEHSR